MRAGHVVFALVAGQVFAFDDALALDTAGARDDQLAPAEVAHALLKQAQRRPFVVNVSRPFVHFVGNGKATMATPDDTLCRGESFIHIARGVDDNPTALCQAVLSIKALPPPRRTMFADVSLRRDESAARGGV